jgi:hypothetical protein
MANEINLWQLIGMASALALCSTESFPISTSCTDPSGYSVDGCVLPGITAGSFPYFDQTVSVTYKGKNSEDNVFSITGKSLKDSQKRWLKLDDETTVFIPDMKIKLAVKVDGAVARGNLKNPGGVNRICFLGECRDVNRGAQKNPGDALSIKGKIPELGKFRVSADLKGGWDASDNSMFWNFDITNITCSGALASRVDCAPDGILYLNLLEAIGPTTGANKIKTAGISLTSVAVPVPAAIWLFSSGLLGLGAVARYQGTQPPG